MIHTSFIALDTLNTSVFPYTMLNIGYTDYISNSERALEDNFTQYFTRNTYVAEHKFLDNHVLVYFADSMKYEQQANQQNLHNKVHTI